jgi:hypothetical protein
VSSPKELLATRRAVSNAVCREVFGPFHHVHALAAAAGGGFDEQREADVLGGGGQLLVAQAGFGDARDHGDAVSDHVVLGTDLVSHHVDGLHVRADEGDAGGFKGAGESRRSR